MDTRDLDATLDRLRDAAARAAVDVFELEHHPTTALLDAADLDGTTAARWGDARATLDRLLQDAAALSTVIEQAASTRQRVRWPTPSRLGEIEQLLVGPSVVLGAHGCEVARTPDDVLAQIVSRGADVRRLITDITAIWDGCVPAVARCRQRLDDAAALAARLGARLPRDANELESELDDAAELLLSDPLSLDQQRLRHAERVLDDVEAALSPTDRLVADWPAQVTAARSLRETIDDALRERTAVVDVVSMKIAGGFTPDMGSITPDSLDCDLARLLAQADRGAWPEVAEGMRRWNQEANAFLAEIRWTTDVARTSLATRDELRGRLRAYEAMAAAMGVMEVPRIAERRREAETQLHTAPTDLGAAERLVASYAAALLDARKEGPR